MNRKALTVDGPDPVILVKAPAANIIKVLLKSAAVLDFPSMVNVYDAILYIIPMWSPERASICAAPLSLNAWIVSSGISFLVPVNKALASGAVLLYPNPMESMNEHSLSMALSVPSSDGTVCIPVNIRVRLQKTPQKKKQMQREGTEAPFLHANIKLMIVAAIAAVAAEGSRLSPGGKNAADATPAANGIETLTISPAPAISHRFIAIIRN